MEYLLLVGILYAAVLGYVANRQIDKSLDRMLERLNELKKIFEDFKYD